MNCESSNLSRKPLPDRLRGACDVVWLMGLVALVLASWGDAAMKPLIGPLRPSSSYRVVSRHNVPDGLPS